MPKIHVVMVTFHPNVNIVAKNIYNLLAAQVVDVIHIVDNTPGGASIDNFEQSQVCVSKLGENKGIATAQNVGIQMALDADADYVVLFDQDSVLEIGLVPKLLSAIQQAKSHGLKVACLGPRPLDVFSGKKYRPIIQKEKIISPDVTICSQIIASGKIIDAAALKDIGLMEDSLFIDGVDHEWCWRARKHGYVVAIAESAVMEHTLGDARESFLGLSYKVGSAIRMYYQFRNVLILSRRDYVPLYWKFRNILAMIFRFYVFGFRRNDASIRRRYMVQGLIDGFKMHVGPYSNH